MTRLGPVTVDSDIEQYLRSKWRERVEDANRKGDSIPSFSSFMNEVLKEAVRQMKLKETGVK